jgi:hypothetical protein
MDFEQFLGKMSNQTGANFQIPSSEGIMQRHLAEQSTPPPQQNHPKSIPDDPAPPRMPPKQEEQETSSEDTVEKIYEATSAILKTLRQAFPNKNDRMMAFESIQNALSMALNEDVPVRQSARQSAPIIPKTAPTTRPPRGQMVEEGEYIIPRQNMALEGMEYNPGTAEGNYSRKIDIQPGQGLSGVSERDLADLKALAGI